MAAVSMLRQPALRALRTASLAAWLDTWKTPMPTCGMDVPSLSVTLGTVVVGRPYGLGPGGTVD
jgi:hypothetical protein